ncbi:MAG: stage II sporulation protein D [Oscillospiraceae bacterium]|nr:stage II sporulation protein D [Oscillospiraceae bacterium]
MKRVLLLAYLLLLIEFCMPKGESSPTIEVRPSFVPMEQNLPLPTEKPATPPPEIINLIIDGQAVQMDMETYLVGVLAAEMPASFPEEALKAQAVAARSYAMYCLETGKHGGALCPDFACCQAWLSEERLRENWGSEYEKYSEKTVAAVKATAGECLSYEGQAVFAAFHSSSAGATENSGQVWSALPYLVSVNSPETADDVPNFVSSLECSPIDFRDTILYLHPEADFTGEPESWIGEIRRNDSGRVEKAVLGDVEVGGTELRNLFSLRSTAFELEYTGELFRFTVTGFGHGVGMSQYGAKVMAETGSDYRSILAHYYPGTYLS